ncbi:MAG: Gfo/Idh/MocA family oxidoreductase [Candidatus Omnitrophota bacterium]
MKVIFFGLGSIGKRHAELLPETGRHELFAFRSRPGKTMNSPGIKEVYSWDDVKMLKPEAAFITNPTGMHIGTALKCASLGMHLFIEKPLSDRMDGIDELEALVREKRLTCYTAFCLRFHPVIKKIRELVSDKKIYHARAVCTSFLPDWRPRQDHKKHYSAYKGKGGGVILELAHEFDYIQHILGPIKRIRGVCGRTADITVDAEDCADALIALENGVNINMHINFLSHIAERSVKIDFEHGYVIGDLVANNVDYFYKGRDKRYAFTAGRDEYLRKQLEYFFANIGNESIMNNIGEAKALLAKVLEFRNGEAQE